MPIIRMPNGPQAMKEREAHAKELGKMLKEAEKRHNRPVYCQCGKEMVPFLRQCPDKDCKYNLMDVKRSEW